ncbi:Glutathione reductase [Ectocarpus siliculosus]|uniref:Glutathione reductase n=1 Tax=Ectocarpus siliculosus TaxID=2880 RepID=D8LHC1_ECTSI|nr:Glutathione reductase [Ectocarpus siliculosus]|eukprot:CBN74340.1 Glutathione reductase [Ectocarpus siliculosus]
MSSAEATGETPLGGPGGHYDYLVIGGGSGGVSSARRAASHGAKVALIEGTPNLGGTCVNVGCVPKKVMFNAAHINEMLHASKHYGYTVGETSFDWGKLKEMRDAYVRRLNGIYHRNVEKSGVTLVYGMAKFVGPKKAVVEGVEYTADHVMIAVGGTPSMPDVPGAELCINSDGFFDVTEQPKKVAVVGAGYIAVELAGIFDALGTETHLFIRHERAMRTLDPLLSDILDLEMARAGLAVHKNSTTEKITKDEATGKLTLHTKDGHALGDLDVVLMAIGRSPNVGSLGLPSAGVEQSERGHITVDEWQNTSAEGVYALGDVTGRVELTPMAIAAGRTLSDRLFAGMKDAKADYTNVPTVVFSHPPMATCGLTEPDARAAYGEDAVKVYQSKFTNLFFGHWQMPPEDKEKTAMKVIVTGESEKVVGIHIIGMGADEMMQGFGVAMKMGCTKADLDSCVAIHPTASEELVTLAPWGLENGKRSGV